MIPTPATISVGPVRRPFAGPYTHLAIVENTGTVPVRVSTAPWVDPLDGRVIPAGETAQIEPRGTTVCLIADEATTVAVTNYTLDDLKADAADRWNIPVEMFRDDRSMADIADTVVRLTEMVWGEA